MRVVGAREYGVETIGRSDRFPGAPPFAEIVEAANKHFAAKDFVAAADLYEYGFLTTVDDLKQGIAIRCRALAVISLDKYIMAFGLAKVAHNILYAIEADESRPLQHQLLAQDERQKADINVIGIMARGLERRKSSNREFTQELELLDRHIAGIGPVPGLIHAEAAEPTSVETLLAADMFSYPPEQSSRPRTVCLGAVATIPLLARPS